MAKREVVLTRLLVFSLLVPSAASAQWLPGYAQRQPIDVSSSTSLADFQLPGPRMYATDRHPRSHELRWFEKTKPAAPCNPLGTAGFMKSGRQDLMG